MDINVEQYLAGENIIGANVLKDFLASITDIVGGRSSSYERVLREGKLIAMNEMQVLALGASAIIGIDLDYETIRDGMLMVIVAGTAVKISKI